MRSPTEDAALIREALDDGVFGPDDLRALARLCEARRNVYTKRIASRLIAKIWETLGPE